MNLEHQRHPWHNSSHEKRITRQERETRSTADLLVHGVSIELLAVPRRGVGAQLPVLVGVPAEPGESLALLPSETAQQRTRMCMHCLGAVSGCRGASRRRRRRRLGVLAGSLARHSQFERVDVLQVGRVRRLDRPGRDLLVVVDQVQKTSGKAAVAQLVDALDDRVLRVQRGPLHLHLLEQGLADSDLGARGGQARKQLLTHKQRAADD
jgi:hypothetical protein